MMLDQIVRKQEKQIMERDSKPKTVGVKVPPNIYQRLVLLKTKRRLGSIKAAALLAIERGVMVLLNETPPPSKPHGEAQ